MSNNRGLIALVMGSFLLTGCAHSPIGEVTQAAQVIPTHCDPKYICTMGKTVKWEIL